MTSLQEALNLQATRAFGGRQLESHPNFGAMGEEQPTGCWGDIGQDVFSVRSGAEMWGKAEPQIGRGLEHHTSCDSDIHSDFNLALADELPWAEPPVAYYLPFPQPASELGFPQSFSCDSFPPPTGQAVAFFEGPTNKQGPFQEASPCGTLLPNTLCPPLASLPVGLGGGLSLPQEVQACKSEEEGREFEGVDCCAGTPCSNRAETFNVGVLESGGGASIESIIEEVEEVMWQHSPYSPRKRGMFPPTPPAGPSSRLSDLGPNAKLPVSVEGLPRELTRPPSPLASTSLWVDNLGEALEKLPQLKAGVEMEPLQLGVGLRSRRSRKRMGELQIPSSPLKSSKQEPHKTPLAEAGDSGEDGSRRRCRGGKRVTVTASGRRVSQLLLAEEEDQWVEAPEPENNRCKNHKPWTIEETTALVWGVEKTGGGKWAEIKKLDCRETACLERRTAVDLKDKWRNLQNAIDRPPCDKKKGDLSKELVERIRRMRGACNTKARGNSRKSNGGKQGYKRRAATGGSAPGPLDCEEWLPGH